MIISPHNLIKTFFSDISTRGGNSAQSPFSYQSYTVRLGGAGRSPAVSYSLEGAAVAGIHTGYRSARVHFLALARDTWVFDSVDAGWTCLMVPFVGELSLAWTVVIQIPTTRREEVDTGSI